MTILKPQHEHSSVCFRFAGTFAFAVAMLWGQLASAQGPPLPDRVKRVYVPVDDFQAILNRDREGVLLPKREFEALWKQAVDNQIDSSPGPNGLVVSSASYETAVEDRQLLITAKIEFHQYLAGWRSFPLLFRNLGVESASLGDQPARLGRDEQGNLRLFHNQTGRHVLELKLSTPLGAVGSDQVAAFTVLAGP
ncbi:MAG TPA: hypothetical protein VLA12_10835, partial [Planctomycetaceae bacterium]|nr:hypothetical protein [Planctomycetaceae bacterium]